MATTEVPGGRTRVLTRWSSLIIPLWAAVFLFGAADIVTTWVGITMFGAIEANPVVASLMESYGLLVMVPLKLAIVAFAAGASRLFPREWRGYFPLVLAVTWGFVTLWNLSHLALAL